MVNIKWCPEHKDMEENKYTDEEAKMGTKMWTQDLVTLTNTKRKTKEAALKK